jgi:3-oxoacyl-[acyl-carrier-protein] synthase II
MPGRVVVTGVGMLTSLGTGKELFMRNLFLQRSPLAAIPASFEKHYAFKSRFYVPLSIPILNDYGVPSHHQCFMQDVHKIAIVAAKMALADAGFSISSDGRSFRTEGLGDCGVCIGMGFLGMHEGFSSYLAHLGGEDGQTGSHAPQSVRFNRLIVPVMMPNAASAWISILFHLQGSSYTVNASCASGTVAIGQAYTRIKDGYEPVALAGGVECLKDNCGSVMRGFDVLGALTRSEDGRPIPFSSRRSGFLFSEGGGCILVLEELEHARRRGASIYAEIADYRSNSDACSILQTEEGGAQIRRLLENLKGNRTIDYLNSHGTGTAANDSIEARIIQEVFGGKDTQPLVDATKGILGHTIGASGAIEAAVVALSIKESRIHGNAVPDPIANLNLATCNRSVSITYAISTSYGFGGHNAGLLFRRYEG